MIFRGKWKKMLCFKITMFICSYSRPWGIMEIISTIYDKFWPNLTMFSFCGKFTAFYPGGVCIYVYKWLINLSVALKIHIIIASKYHSLCVFLWWMVKFRKADSNIKYILMLLISINFISNSSQFTFFVVNFIPLHFIFYSIPCCISLFHPLSIPLNSFILYVEW